MSEEKTKMTEPFALDRRSWVDFDNRLRGYVRRRVDPDSVDDVVGGILLRLVQHQDDLKAARNPVAWALGVAANAVTDHHRRRASAKRALAQVELEQMAGAANDQAADASADAAAGDLAHCLTPMIRALPAPYGEALMLVDIEGRTQAQAAAHLGLSLPGMKSRVQRGRRKLKQALLRCCSVELDRRGGVVNYSRRSGESCGRC